MLPTSAYDEDAGVRLNVGDFRRSGKEMTISFLRMTAASAPSRRELGLEFVRKGHLGLLVRDAGLAVLGVRIPLDDPDMSLIELEHLPNVISRSDSRDQHLRGQNIPFGDTSCK